MLVEVSNSLFYQKGNLKFKGNLSLEIKLSVFTTFPCFLYGILTSEIQFMQIILFYFLISIVYHKL